MVFSSLEFIFRFLPLFLMIYYMIPDYWKNFWLLAGSLGFYFAPILPLGISFYTFQALFYLVDVYRKEVPCERPEAYPARH